MLNEEINFCIFRNSCYLFPPRAGVALGVYVLRVL